MSKPNGVKFNGRQNGHRKMREVLVIGSGPIVIGQAAEFDYSGAQACLALREEGVKSILVNSNPATIQTDKEVADKVYIEPLTWQFLERIIAREKPDGVIATVGGQTALNLVTQLDKKGVLKKYNVEVLGTSIQSINLGESREEFRKLMEKIGQPIFPSRSVKTLGEGLKFAQKIGRPLIIRSAYALGGTGGSLVYRKRELEEKITSGLAASMIGEVLIEKSAIGQAELEYELVRDRLGNKIMVCNMENVDPMGVHTGESVVVAPSQTLSDREHQMLRTAAFKIVDALNIIGGCNIQFALDQTTGKYSVIEVNPRLSRSSALASKATGYPIAKVAAKIALGKTLPEIKNTITGKTAFFEPALDYVVIKIPRWPDDKFATLDKNIGVQMKSTGEVMAIGRSFEEAMYKAIASLDVKFDYYKRLSNLEREDIKERIKVPNTQRFSAMFAAFELGLPVKEISSLSRINPWFIHKLKNLYDNRSHIFSKVNNYKMVDTCAGEFEAFTPYFYSTQGDENEAPPLPGPKVIILGSGPIRIGQGIEFDYLTVHAVKALKEKGIKAIIINNNPETVSTDYSISDRLYFEPLSPAFVMKIIENERPGLIGVIPQFGGQTAINLVNYLDAAGVPILGSSPYTINAAEDRKITGKIFQQLGLTMPKWNTAQSRDDLIKRAEGLGYPVVIRPSYVLGGEGMIVAHKREDILAHLQHLGTHAFDTPILIDKFLEDAIEVDIDFISDGKNTLSFVLEQLEPAGVHSGDSSCVYPVQNISKQTEDDLKEIAHKVSMAFGIIGMGNIQCAIKNGKIYILEVNPRASRTVPFLSKCLGISLTKVATRVILGGGLPKLKLPRLKRVAIKVPVFSFEKLIGLNPALGPLMKSTGEKMTVGRTFKEAMSKVHDKNSSKDMGKVDIFALN